MNKRNQQRYEETQARILDVAQVLVQQNGFERLSLREIARYVEYSPAALYEYYDGKDHIIDSLCERIDSRIASYMQEVLPTQLADPGELTYSANLQELIDAPLWDVDDAAPSLVLLSLRYLQFSQHCSDDFQLLYRRTLLPDTLEQVWQVFCSAAEQAFDTFELSAEAGKETVASAFWSMAHGFALLSLNRQGTLPLNGDALKETATHALMSLHSGYRD